jgi:hypothetical protein
MALLPFVRDGSNVRTQNELQRQLLESVSTEVERAHGATSGAFSLLNELKKLFSRAQFTLASLQAAVSGVYATFGEIRRLVAAAAREAAQVRAAASGTSATLGEVRKIAASVAREAAQVRAVASGANAVLEEVRRKVKISKINYGGWEDLSLDFAPSRDLLITNNATNPNYQLDIDATSITLISASGNLYKVSGINLTVDITASGANGLDTGSEAASTWYHVYVIWNGSTIAGLLSTSSTAPTMPSGYTHKGYVGAIYNWSSGNFITVRQRGYAVACGNNLDINNGTAASATSFAIQVPTTAKYWSGLILVSGTNKATQVSPLSTMEASQYAGYSDAIVNSIGNTYLPIFTSQTMWYVTGGTTSIWTVGWSY